MLDAYGVRTKTDTGRRDEYSQALERTLVKELCDGVVEPGARDTEPMSGGVRGFVRR